jgi:selenophosphate synthetase-related protein
VKPGKITLSAIGHTAEYLHKGQEKLEIDLIAGETIADILGRLNVAKELFMFALVKDERVELSYSPQPGDEIVLVSPIMGG